MILDFHVTQDDIDKAEQGVKGQCAESISFRRTHGDKYGFFDIDKETIIARDLIPVEIAGIRYRKILTWFQPYPNWIKNFDKDRTTVDPITVRLDTDYADVTYKRIKSSGSNTSKNVGAQDNGQSGKRKKLR